MTAQTPSPLPQMLTVKEAAQELRCSKAHVLNAIAGRLRTKSRLPAVAIGRRKLIRRRSLEQWITANESALIEHATLRDEPETDSVCARKEDFHA